MQVPKRQQIDIHTVAVQWAPFKRLTLSLALPILVNQMKQLGPGAMPYTSSSSGVGDLEFVGIVPFIKKKNETLDIHFGLNIPIDSSNDKRREGELLPYSMQSDSSNWNIIAGLAYRGHHKGLSWGVHATGEIGFGTNDHGYRVGNRIEINGWLGHEITSWLSGTARLGYKRWTRVRHAVSSGPENHPGSYTRNTGSDRLWLGPGLNLALPVLGVQHLSIEALWPVFQSLRGSQLEADWTLTTRWEWIF